MKVRSRFCSTTAWPGSRFFDVALCRQPGQSLCYAEDVVGRRQYRLKVKDLATGRTLGDVVENVEDNLVWADDNRTIYYIEKDPVTLLSKRVKAHVLGTPASADRLIYDEKDDSYYMAVERTSDDKYICIFLRSTVSNEQRCTSAAAPGEFATIAPRERDFLYEADHIGDHWIIRTNWSAPNYRLMTLKDAAAAGGRAAWTDLVAHDPAVFIENFQPFDSFVAIEQRSGGNKKLRLLMNSGRSREVAADGRSLEIGTIASSNTTSCATYDSLATPRSTISRCRDGRANRDQADAVANYDPAKYPPSESGRRTRRDANTVSMFYRRASSAMARRHAACLWHYASEDPNGRRRPQPLDRGMSMNIPTSAAAEMGPLVRPGEYAQQSTLQRLRRRQQYLTPSLCRQLRARRWAAATAG